MRRSYMTALAAVSFVALIGAATTSGAVVPTMNLGLLKAQGQWKVGTVSTAGDSYCAMVNKFDKQVVLAFARSPEGFGSIAMDFRERFFEAGAEYEVSLKADGGRTRNLVGRASSDRSIVVQVGQDDRFFEALGANGILALGLPTIDVSFALRRFSASYKNLVSCAKQLTGDMSKVEQTDLAPIDREVEKLAEERNQVASASREARKLQDRLKEKNGGFDEMEEQLEKEARVEQKKANEAVAALDDREEGLKEKLEEVREQATALEEKKEKVERKLLAAMGKDVPAAAAGMTAQQLEQQQVAVSSFLRAEEAEKKAAWMKDKVAALEAEKAKAADAAVSDFNARQKELAGKTLELQQQRDKMAAEAGSAKGAKAGVVAKQAQIAAVEAERTQQSEALTQKLATAQTDYQARIAALEAERDGLQKKLDTAMAANFDKLIQPAAGGDPLAGKLQASEEERQKLQERIRTLEKQTQLLEASLNAKDGGNGRTTAQKELADLRAGHASAMAGLQKQLDERTAQYNVLRAQVDARETGLSPQKAENASAGSALGSKHGKILTELAVKQEAISRLERQLKDVEIQRSAEAERAMKAQADLETARKEISRLRAGLGGDQQRLAALTASLEQQKGQLEKRAGEQAAEAKRLEKERAEIASMREELKSGKGSAGATRERLAGIAAAPLDDAAMSAMKKEIEARQAELDRQTAAQAEQAEWIAREKASIMRVRSGAPVETLMASEKAELEEARRRIQQLEQQYGQTQNRIAALDGSFREGRTVALAGNATALAELEKRAAGLDAREKELAAARQAFEEERRRISAAAPAPDSAKLRQAQGEIERLRAENAALAQKLSRKGQEGLAAELNAAEPSTGEYIEHIGLIEERQVAKEEVSGGLGYRRAAAPVQGYAMPAVPVAPVVAGHAASAAVKGAGAAANRAAAFLDRIMAYHRPEGAKAVADESDYIEETITERVVVSSPRAESSETHPHYNPDPVPAAVRPKAEELTAIETSSGTVMSESAEMPPVQEKAPGLKNGFVPQAPVAPLVPAVSQAPETIEGILSKSGIREADFSVSETDGNAAQWTTGEINGMFEQLPSPGAEFGANMDEYLARYREDCPAHLEVNIGPSQDTPAGTLAVADISCAMPANTYVSSFVFLQNNAGFNAILHTGYPESAAKLRSFSDNIAYTLGSSAGIAAPASARSAGAQPVAPGQSSLKFKIGIEAPSAYVPVSGNGLETVIVQ